MSEKGIVAPEGMLYATCQQWRSQKCEVHCVNEVSYLLEAALLWQRDNPITPTHDQTIALCKVYETNEPNDDYCSSIRRVALEWQRIMFLAPEPEVPELADVVAALLAYMRGNGKPLSEVDAKFAAYRRGQQSKEPK